MSEPKYDRVRLKQAESLFLHSYPEGFADPVMQARAKKHRVVQMVEQAQALLNPSALENTDQAIDNVVKLVSRASIVSMFEKPRFRDVMRSLTRDERAYAIDCISELLHGDKESGINRWTDFLVPFKLAKWSLVTVMPAYYAPCEEVFVKPTTAKGIIDAFAVEDLHYRPRPSWAFYQGYRQLICDMKSHVDVSLSPYHLAFTGFLMMTQSQLIDS